MDAYDELLPDIDRALFASKDKEGDKLGLAIAFLLDRHPNRTSSDLMNWIIRRREELP